MSLTNKRRNELSELNRRAWDGFQGSSNGLDTTLKKNNNVVRKLKTLNAVQKQSLIQDISTTSLEKYLDEVISSTAEGAMKCKKDDDLLAAIEVISLLHQRFTTQFTPAFVFELLFAIQDPSKVDDEKTKSAVASRVRTCTKLLTEAILTGIVDNDVNNFPVHSLIPPFMEFNTPFSVGLLNHVFQLDLQNGSLITLQTKFFKVYHVSLFSEPEYVRKFNEEQWKPMKQFLDEHFRRICNSTYITYKQLVSQKDKGHQISMKTGKLIEGIETEIEALEKNSANKFELVQAMSQALEKKAPDIKAKVMEKLQLTSNDGIQIVKTEVTLESLIWPDEEDRAFYTNYTALRGPAEDPAAQQAAAEEEKKGNAKEQANYSATPYAKNFVAKLRTVRTISELNDAIAEFWVPEKFKTSTVKILFTAITEQNDSSRFKYFCRFLAMAKDTLTGLVNDVIDYCDSRLRGQLHSQYLNLKPVLLFSELIKFKLVPVYVIFHKIRTAILNLRVQNDIELLAVLFDECGKIFLNDPDYKGPTQEMIELLKERKQKVDLDYNMRQSVEMALRSMEPDKVKKITHKVVIIPPEEAFLKRLFLVELNTKSVPEAVDIVSQYGFENLPNCYDQLKTCLTSPEDVNYDNISALAKFLRIYTMHNQPLKVFVVDAVIEKIQRSLELNDYRTNRTRLAMVTYLAHMSHEHLIKTPAIIDVMYRILCFGHPNNNPVPGENQPDADPADNYFRISLICQMLTNMRRSHLSPSIKRKLTIFMVYFDYYCNTKQQPIPSDTNFKLVTMYKIVAPHFERSKDWMEAAEKLQAAIGTTDVDVDFKEQSPMPDDVQTTLDEQEESDESEDSDDSDDDTDDDEEGEYQIETYDEDDNESENDDSDDDDNDDDSDSDEDDEEDLHKAAMERAELERIQEDLLWEANLDKEMRQMVAASMEARRLQKIDKFQVSLPSPETTTTKFNNATTESSPNKPNEGKVAFKLLSKSHSNTSDAAGNKRPVIATRKIELPQNSSFAERLREQEIKTREESARLKQFILNIQD